MINQSPQNSVAEFSSNLANLDVNAEVETDENSAMSENEQAHLYIKTENETDENPATFTSEQAYPNVKTETDLNEDPVYKGDEGKELILGSEIEKIQEKTKSSFPCLFCGKVFKRRGDLNRHFSLHTGEKIYRCAICRALFSTGRQLQKHRAALHSDEKNWTCSACAEEFESRQKLSLHMKKFHSMDKPDTFQCEICFISFGTKQELSEHDVNIHKRVDKNTCVFCGAIFTYPSDLKRHERKHTGFRPYICNICSKPYANANQLSLHIQKHQQHVNFQCGECQKGFLSNSDLRRHLRRLHNAKLPFTCAICKSSFPTQEEFHTHRRDIHGLIPNRVEKKPMHKCEICLKTFRFPSDIKRHLRSHSSERLFTCEICMKPFKTEWEVQRHKQRAFCDNKKAKGKKNGMEEEETACPVCQKIFKKTGLQTHIATIHKESYICKKCGDIFVMKEELAAHKKNVHCKVFNCDFCGKNFKSKIILENHVRIHTKETPFQCHICARQFKQKVHLMSHISLHGNKKICCQLCSKEFRRKYDLKRHVRKHHSSDVSLDEEEDETTDAHVQNEEWIDIGINESVKEIINSVMSEDKVVAETGVMEPNIVESEKEMLE